MIVSRFDLFIDQQNRFRKALSDYDHGIWFPPLRGRFEEGDPDNWFISSVPASWGKWKGTVYGVHFDFKYGGPRHCQPERIRLVIGVETPMHASKRQAFKEDVISGVKARRIPLSGFFLQARHRKKLLETDPDDPILFNSRSWRISLQRYIALQPLVETMAVIVREYYDNGSYEIPMDFPKNSGSQTDNRVSRVE